MSLPLGINLGMLAAQNRKCILCCILMVYPYLLKKTNILIKLIVASVMLGSPVGDFLCESAEKRD